MRRWISLFIFLFALGFSFVRVYGVVGGAGDKEPAPMTARGATESRFIYDSEGLNDPFVPLIVPTEPPSPTPAPATPTPPGPTPTPTPTPVRLPPVSVDVIMSTDQGQRLAVINSRLVGPGDFVDDIEVLEVYQHEIHVLYMNTKFVVSPAEDLERAMQGTTSAQFEAKTMRKGRRR